MPNHVTNRISFRGDPEAIHRMLEAVKNEEEGYGSIDFNKILPMPRELNMESGSRTTEGIKLYNAFLEIYKLGQGQNVDLFSVPEESEKAFLKMRTDIDKKTWKLGRAACRNIQQFGCATWYEWCNRHWGTKWNAYDFTGETDSVTFHTAWSAPWPVMRELSRQYPDIEVTLSWADEDIGHNCGRYVYSGGNVTEEFNRSFIIRHDPVCSIIEKKMRLAYKYCRRLFCDYAAELLLSKHDIQSENRRFFSKNVLPQTALYGIIQF